MALETSLIAGRAAVYKHDPVSNSWASADSGLSRVDVYQHQQLGTYRVVGVDSRTKEFSINTSLFPQLVYQKASGIFHQWTDSQKESWGLNFASVEEADNFANVVQNCITQLAAGPRPPVQPQPPAQPAQPEKPQPQPQPTPQPAQVAQPVQPAQPTQPQPEAMRASGVPPKSTSTVGPAPGGFGGNPGQPNPNPGRPPYGAVKGPGPSGPPPGRVPPGGPVGGRPPPFPGGVGARPPMTTYGSEYPQAGAEAEPSSAGAGGVPAGSGSSSVPPSNPTPSPFGGVANSSVLAELNSKLGRQPGGLGGGAPAPAGGPGNPGFGLSTAASSNNLATNTPNKTTRFDTPPTTTSDEDQQRATITGSAGNSGSEKKFGNRASLGLTKPIVQTPTQEDKAQILKQSNTTTASTTATAPITQQNSNNNININNNNVSANTNNNNPQVTLPNNVVTKEDLESFKKELFAYIDQAKQDIISQVVAQLSNLNNSNNNNNNGYY